ncbi:MAG TPA: hypothetical protein DF383_12745 [Deltaproteobacteria bacterium]|nr:hypothetical protein [Deltaproteobacteria bacterium]
MLIANFTQKIRATFTSCSNSNSTPNSPSCSAYGSSSYQSSSGSLMSEAQHQIFQSKAEIARQIEQPDAKTLEKLASLNQKRAAQGQIPIDLKKTSADLEAIQNDRSLSPKEKKKKIEALRKSLGLSKKEMKSLFTKRLEKIYKNAEKSLATFQKAKEQQLQSELRQAEVTYGKNSPQAQAAQNKLDALKNTLEPERKRLGEHAHFYGSLYPSFWSKLGGFFKKVGQGFGKVFSVLGSALRFIPGIGPIASKIVGAAKYLFQGKIGKMFSEIGRGIWEGIKNYKQWLPMIPGIGSIASFAVTGIEAIMKATRGGGR